MGRISSLEDFRCRIILVLVRNRFHNAPPQRRPVISHWNAATDALYPESAVRRLSPTGLHFVILALLPCLHGCAGLSRAPSAASVSAAAASPQRDPKVMAQAAATAYAAHRWADSERLYTELVTREPDQVEAWFKLGNLYARSQRPDYAVRAYREVLSREPHHVRALHNLGMVQLRDAAASFEQLENVGAADDPLVRHGAVFGTALQNLLQQKSTDPSP